MVTRLLGIPLLVIVLLAGCAPAPQASTDPTAAATTSAPPAAYPLTLLDDAGREVTLDAEPARIVSLAPSSTEIVCALDACGRLVGVTDIDDFPAEVADVDKVVFNAQVDVEAVVAAEPELVIAAGNELTPTTVIDQLIGLGIPVLTLYPESLEGVYANIDLLGRALGLGDEADVLVDDMTARAADVEAAVADLDRPRTFYEVSVFEGVIYTAGENSFLASLIETAGGEPVVGDALSTSIELEDLVAADPQLILLGAVRYDPTVTPASVAERPGWETMTAVVEGRVVPVSEDVVITRPGPRIVDGLEALARAIHPDAFEEG